MTTPLKKAAESVMQQFVVDFARRGDPAKYLHSPEGYNQYIRMLRDEAQNHIHGATMLMIASGNARPGDFNTYKEQIDAIEAVYLAELKNKPE
jgi:hypothetical protein